MSLDLTDGKSTGWGHVLVTIREQAITWANVDSNLCRWMASPGQDELKT